MWSEDRDWRAKVWTSRLLHHASFWQRMDADNCLPQRLQLMPPYGLMKQGTQPRTKEMVLTPAPLYP